MRNGLAFFGLFACSVAVAANALAVPPWSEGPADAGSTFGTHRVVTSASAVAVGMICGAGLIDGIAGYDTADLIEVNIDNPDLFHIELWGGAGSTDFDAQLFLFRKVTLPNGTLGLRGLLCFDNLSSTNSLPEFNNNGGYWQGTYYAHPMTSAMASIGESFTPGRYVVGVSVTTRDPYHSNGPSAATPLFNVPAIGLGIRSSPLSPELWLGSGGIGEWVGYVWDSSVHYIPAETAADAEFVFGPGVKDIDNTGAVDSDGLIDGCQPLGRDVWYRVFMGCGAHEVRASTCNRVSFDSVIELYSGTPSALEFVACNDDFCCTQCQEFSSIVTTCPAVPGPTEYFVRVGSYGVTAGGSGTIEFECLTAPGSSDLNHDGVVNGEDLAIVMNGWSGG